MASLSTAELPERVTVTAIVSSRYRGHVRPRSWDDRRAGVDTIQTSDGRTLKLQSDGQQSPPQVGWVILLSGGDEISGYLWTLYGMPKMVPGESLSVSRQ